MFTPPIALSIAGSDPSGGAGIQADLKAFSALGVYGAAVITALTAQNTQGVTGIHAPSADFVALQARTVLEDLRVDAIKLGMLFSADIIHAVAGVLKAWPHIPVVLDPVMVSTSGHRLLNEDAIAALVGEIMPLAAIVTPNLHEAALLSGLPLAQTESDIDAQGRAILALGAQGVLIKGGHGNGRQSVDYYYDGQSRLALEGERIDTDNTHGTGCTLSSAIAAGLAKGLSLEEALGVAKHYLSDSLTHGKGMRIGRGFGPVHHFYRLWS